MCTRSHFHSHLSSARWWQVGSSHTLLGRRSLMFNICQIYTTAQIITNFFHGHFLKCFLWAQQLSKQNSAIFTRGVWEISPLVTKRRHILVSLECLTSLSFISNLTCWWLDHSSPLCVQKDTPLEDTHRVVFCLFVFFFKYWTISKRNCSCLTFCRDTKIV